MFLRHRGYAARHHRTSSLAGSLLAVLLLPLLVGGLAGGVRADIAVDDFSLPTGANPQSLSAADCDGNGTPDLVTANFGDNTVTIHPNLGGGLFGPAVTLDTVASPAGAACADFTGDGIYDVAVASFTGDAVTVYAGQEAGGFAAIGTYAVGSGCRTISVADFDGNGTLDLAVVNSQSDDVSFLYGDGSGGFPFQFTLKIDGIKSSNPPVAAVSYDDDGSPALALVSQGQPSLHVIVDGGVSTAALPVLPRSRGVGAGDVDGDGIPDLVVLSTAALAQILHGNADGSFVLDHSFLVRANARAVAVSDFDGDGLTDIAVAYNDSNSIQIIRAAAPGIFPSAAAAATSTYNPLGLLAARATSGSDQLLLVEPASRSVVQLDENTAGGLVPTTLAPLAGDEPQALLLADMNNDSILDAVVAAKVGREVSLEILPGLSSGSGFQAAASGPIDCGNGVINGAEVCDDGNTKNRDGCSKTCQVELGRGPLSMSAADIDGDGNRDLVVVDSRGRIQLLLGDGAAHVKDIETLGVARSKTPAKVADFDGNGTLDVAFLPRRSREGAVAVLFNDGTGNFAEVPVVPKGRFRGPVLAGDVDGNGLPDLVLVTRSKPKGITTLLNDGGGPVRVAPSTEVPNGLTTLAGADFNEDGQLDLLAEFSSRRQLPLILRGLGGGVFAKGDPPSSQRFVGGMVFDVDHDLHKDIVVCDGGSTSPCRALYGDGAGAFSDAPGSPNDRIGGDLAAFAEGDLDGDNLVDLVGVSNSDSRVVVLFRNPNGAQLTRVELGGTNKPNAVAIGDVTNDGKPDIVVANSGTHDLTRFRNTGNRTFTSDGLRFSTDGVKPRDIALAQLDGSGGLDVVVSLETLDADFPQDGAGVVLFRSQNPNGQLARMARLSTGKQPDALAVGKLNGDAQPDIVTANLADDTLTVLLSQPGGGWAPTTIASDGDRPTDVVLGDVDGDTALDIIAVNEASGNIVVFLNDGTGGFGSPISTVPPGRDRPWSLCVGDFDTDGHHDLAVASIGTTDILLLRGAGDGTWYDDQRDFPIGKDPHPISCRDVDGDNLSDVLFLRRASGRVDVVSSAP
jgi:cysteine-rich repeat protein